MRLRSENALVFMVKWPEPGRAKTRLSPPLSPDDAAALARAFLLDTLTAAAACDADRWLAYAPVAAAPSFRSLVGPHVGLIAAEAADLGVALERSQCAAFELGYRRVALVASDLPHLDVGRYAAAFTALERSDLAIGPSSDGGYYLIAGRRPAPHLFRGMAWSTSAVFDETRRRAGASGLSVTTLATCDDVDTAADLPWLFDTLRRRPGAGHTLALLEQIAPRLDGAAADRHPPL
jgi:uncharacterized protein